MLKFLEKQKEKQENYAGSSRRFFAYSVDNCLVSLLRITIFVFYLYVSLAVSFQAFVEDFYVKVQAGLYDATSSKDLLKFLLTHPIKYQFLFIFSLVFIAGSLYWVLLPVSKFGGTFGKLSVAIKIARQDGQEFTLMDSVQRYLVGLIPWSFHIVVIMSLFAGNTILLISTVLVISLWYQTSLLGRSHLAVHDIICGTKVVNNSSTAKPIIAEASTSDKAVPKKEATKSKAKKSVASKTTTTKKVAANTKTQQKAGNSKTSAVVKKAPAKKRQAAKKVSKASTKKSKSASKSSD